MASADQEQDQEQQHAHPTVAQYVEIGVILAVVTAAEVALYFADIPREITVPSLLVLTAIKFVLVVMWFMHLRYDNRLFTRLFVAGMAIALAIFAWVAWIFWLQ